MKPVLLSGIVLLLPVMLSFGGGFLVDGPDYGPPIELPENNNAADPAVIEVDGTYYLYPTTTGRSVECWSSGDLEEWTYEGVVWGPAEPGSWNDNLVWAPDVLEYGGQFYLYYTANDLIGLAVADNPAGPFVDVYDHPFIGLGYGNTLALSIDAHVLHDDDGKLYMYCTVYVPVSALRVCQMPDPFTVSGDWQVVTVPLVEGWEFFINEAPWIVKNDDLYYLMYSGNCAQTLEYAIGYAVSESPLGPFEKFSGNPILATDMDHDFWGPGHHSVVGGAKDRLWMVYHTKSSPEQGWHRQLRKNEIDFDSNGELYVVLDGYRDDDDDNDTGDDDDDNDDDLDDDDDEPVGGDDDDDDSGCCG